MLKKVDDWSSISKEKKKKVCREILDQTNNGKELLGIYILGTGKFDYNPENGECDIERMEIIYYMFHTDREDNNFYVRGFVAGQTLKYMAERSGVHIEEPEQYTYVFRIDGRFRHRESDGSVMLRVDEVYTKYDLRRRGLARQGFDYLKGLALERKAYRVLGEMDWNYKALGLQTFYEEIGFETIFPETGNPFFSMYL